MIKYVLGLKECTVRLYLNTIYTHFDIVRMVPLDSGKSSVLWTESICGPGALASG